MNTWAAARFAEILALVECFEAPQRDRLLEWLLADLSPDRYAAAVRALDDIVTSRATDAPSGPEG